MKKLLCLVLLALPLPLLAQQESENPLAAKFYEGYLKTSVGFANVIDYSVTTDKGYEADYTHNEIKYTLSADTGLMFRWFGLFFAGAGFSYDYIYNNATSFQYLQTADFTENQRLQTENVLHILNFSTMSLFATMKYGLFDDASFRNMYLTANIGYGTARNDGDYTYKGGLYAAAGLGCTLFGDYNLEIGYSYRQGSVSWQQETWSGTAQENVEYSADYTYSKVTVAVVKTF